MAFEKGRKLLATGFRHPKLFEIMLSRSVEYELDLASDQLLHQACDAFPEKRVHFAERDKEYMLLSLSI